MSERQGGRKVKKVPVAKAPSAKVSAAKASAVDTSPADVPASDIAPVAFEASLDAPSMLKLEAQCTLRESIAFKAALLEQLELGRDVVLDAGSVSKVDTAGLQLLVAFVRQLRAGGRTLSWQAVTPELQRAAAQLDLLDLIGISVPAAGLQ